MIISHKYKFIFIKTRKTAGTTIEYNLSKYLGNDDIIAPSEQANYLAQNYIQQTSLSRFFEVLKFKKLSKNFYFEFNELLLVLNDLGIKNFKIEKSVNNKFRGINPIITKNQKKIIYKEFQSSLKFVNY